MHTKENFQYGFIQFKTEEIASTVLLRSPHWISNCMVKAKVADFWHQTVSQPEPPNPLYVPPEQDSDSQILNALNDDCLREIFKYFDVRDLTSVADVCVRFNELATKTFSSSYKMVIISSSTSEKFQESLLRNFGSSIEAIGFMSNTRNSDNSALRLIGQHCTTKLKQFSLMSFHFENKWPNFYPNFAQLETLTLVDCHFKNGTKQMLSTCADLKKLDFYGCFWNDKCLNQTFSKIERAGFNSNFGFSNSEFDAFITLNPTLKYVSVIAGSLDSSKVIQSVIQKLPTLLELEIDLSTTHPKEFEKLGQLNCLKVLKLNFNSLSVTPLMKSLVENRAPIEKLAIIKGQLDTEAIDTIAQMKEIQILDFVKCYGLTDEHIIAMATGLPQLQEFHLQKLVSANLSTTGMKKMVAQASKLKLLELNFIDDIEIDVNDYKMMLKAVQNRPEKIKLLIEIKNNGDKVDGIEEILMENRNYLEINEEIEDNSDMSMDSSDSSDYGYMHGNWRFDEDSDDGFLDYLGYFGHEFFDEFFEYDSN